MKNLMAVAITTIILGISTNCISQITVTITNNSGCFMMYGFTPWDGVKCHDYRYVGVSGGIDAGAVINVNAPSADPTDVLRNCAAQVWGCTANVILAEEWAGGCGTDSPGSCTGGGCGGSWNITMTGPYSFEIN